jgi:mRNA interferase YafQ
MLNFYFSRKYKKSFKKLKKSGNFNQEKVKQVVFRLVNNGLLDPRHKDHQLNGIFSEHRECHIENDLLLIYKISSEKNYLELTDIGSHSDLFE